MTADGIVLWYVLLIFLLGVIKIMPPIATTTLH
jgi:hypothetical protein